ncbi:hypothetical protein [Nocardioides sp. AE5]|uniref:hypothetical protein n=1 Tax=Nocardioides sp. AE5 TaxID=2962573 RepID=UPI0028822C29|nr:hypothetical protein [Nocardioides sp. AE5]MDT0203471.1 hypothetical protein [Nocardioides sp. AE5]
MQMQAHRDTMAGPSYGEIAERIRRARIDRGVPEHAARIARSTVYDAFRLGRARVNLELIGEIAQAMGIDEVQVQAWIEECDTPRDLAVDAAPEPAPVEAPGRAAVAGVIAGCIALNFLGRIVVDATSLPIYLDMVGTCLGAIALGPWRGALVGGSTNVIAVVTSGLVSLPFAVVNIAGALVWGYGVRRFGLGRSLARFFALCLAAAVACSALAIPVLLLVFGGSVGQGQDAVTRALVDLGLPLWSGVMGSNLLTSGVDKVISGFVALVGVSLLPVAFRSHVPLVTGAVPDQISSAVR